PDMLVAPDGETVAVRGADGRLHFLRPPADKFIARAWLRRDGDSRDIAQAVGMEGLRCDALGCVVTRKGVTIAASMRAEALADDCQRAQLVVSAVTVRNCKGPALVIDREAANAGQGWEITLSSPPRAQSVREWRGSRPWVAAINTAE
ncbi:MAG TPA: hypothetical protein VG889_09830, partial [Rhizomicrobium sp.]|nr:hypothetical protein [Rhizomicrobium sp.]